MVTSNSFFCRAYAASYQRVIAADTSLARSNGESNGENRVHSNRNRRQFLDGAGRYHHVGRLQLRELFGDGRSDSCVFATAKDVRRLEPLAVNRVDPVMCRVCRVLQHGYWPCDLADAAGSGMVLAPTKTPHGNASRSRPGGSYHLRSSPAIAAI